MKLKMRNKKLSQKAEYLKQIYNLQQFGSIRSLGDSI